MVERVKPDEDDELIKAAKELAETEDIDFETALKIEKLFAKADKNAKPADENTPSIAFFISKK